jgi:hypothetical protein
MIYGINFTGKKEPGYTDMGFPPDFARKFRKSLRLKVEGMPRMSTARLVGIADSERSRDDMLIQANNGHRRLYVVERKTAGPTLYGIYTY